MDKEDIAVILAGLTSFILAMRAVNQYNDMVAGLPRTGWAVQFYLPQWNQAIAWLNHQLILAMTPYITAVLGRAVYDSWKAWKKEKAEPFPIFLAKRWASGWIHMFEKLMGRCESWANTNTSENA